VARTEWRAPARHPERSEGSAAMGTEILRCAQVDMGERRMTPGGRCVSPDELMAQGVRARTE